MCDNYTRLVAKSVTEDYRNPSAVLQPTTVAAGAKTDFSSCMSVSFLEKMHLFTQIFETKKSPPPSINIFAEACQQLSKPYSTPPIKTTLIKRTEISWLPSQRLMPGIFSPLSSLSFKHCLHDMRRRHVLNVSMNTKLCDDVPETLQHAFSMISLPSEVR